MDLTRARAILAELDGGQLDDIDMEIAHRVDEGDIHVNDCDQPDDWADRMMGDRDRDSVGDLMATRMAARLRGGAWVPTDRLGARHLLHA